MKKIFVIVFFVGVVLSGKSQNLQLHYDFGEGRKYLTSTIEMFRPDSWGSTFFFVDMDYSSDSRHVNNGISLAYWEIARAFKWNDNQKIQPRIEYNGGTFKLDGENAPFIPIENCWLAGVEHTWSSVDFSKIFTLQANYKYIKGKENVSFQLTAVWEIQMCANKFTFSGFADFWKEEMFWGTDFRFITELQIWYNFNKNLALGSEIEISSNFVDKGFKVMPTIGAKVTF